MNDCPDCDARRRAAEEKRRRDDRNHDYIIRMVMGYVSVGMPIIWISELLDVKAYSLMPGALAGALLGFLLFYRKRNRSKEPVQVGMVREKGPPPLTGLGDDEGEAFQ